MRFQDSVPYSAPCPIVSPNPGESGAAAPFLRIETAQGNVDVWALGEDRYRITATGYEQLVVGFEVAPKGNPRRQEW
jgi:hypothetical protein